MKISLNEIKKLVPEAANVETKELMKLIGARLVEIEGSADWGKKFEGIYIVRVVSAEPIPETHLHLCQIDTGAAGGDFAKDDGLVQVVCGAPNVHAGMLAAWIRPGAVVPSTFETDEPFEIGARKLRGYESNGMLAAADELDLGEDHAGIIEIDPEMKVGATEFGVYASSDGAEIEPGMTLAEVFELNDVILDIENKSLTHRPDCFGLIGFAREVAGILGVKFKEPRVFELVAGAEKAGELKLLEEKGELDVQITDPELCPRYSAAVVEFPEAPKNPYFSKSDAFLAKAGMRGISPIVDLTNILMLETGQPMHAFDYDKFKIVGQETPKNGKANDRPTIIVRTAREGEELTLLDGKIVKCHEDDILITSNGRPVAMAGAMGGANTEIDATTKKIILESATFSLYHLRKTQMAHGIFSEAITRFTKGQPASLTLPVLSEAVARLGQEALEVADCQPTVASQTPITLTVAKANGVLGTEYNAEEIKKTLENVGFEVEVGGVSSDEKADRSGGVKLTVIVPAWRTDVHISEDVIEEIGRLLGYNNIPLQLPLRPFRGASEDALLTLKNQLRDLLSERLNMNEVLTYSFVSQKLQETVDEDPEDSYEIVNSISPELQRFRQTIVPSLLEKVHDNLKAGFADFALYEINQVSRHSLGLNNENVPEMKAHLAVTLIGDFYAAKANLNALMEGLGLAEAEYMPIEAGAGYYEKLHSAAVVAGGVKIGTAGEIKPRVLKALKIEALVAAVEIDLGELLKVPARKTVALKLSKFPTVSRDLTLQVASEQTFGPVMLAVEETLTDLIATVKPVSIYQKDPAKKNLSFHLEFSHPEKTLNSEEISDIMKKVETVAAEKFGAQVI